MRNFIKPSIKFPTFPAIYLWIQADYNNVTTYGQYVDFIHKCLTQAESKNEVRAKTYGLVAKALYSAETNISFESKTIELLANSK